eukprot:TRINITY_DN22037_c0_g1_i1.p2 TRINITY_DN22037_c0_g1~~TRINITY_DN22037_c0_g1_i1.p2  ORF type:complete len:106 (+),score=15.74 TRINITY_DN22037_c0_g1_i1:350-667(+)
MPISGSTTPSPIAHHGHTCWLALLVGIVIDKQLLGNAVLVHQDCISLWPKQLTMRWASSLACLRPYFYHFHHLYDEGVLGVACVRAVSPSREEEEEEEEDEEKEK